MATVENVSGIYDVTLNTDGTVLTILTALGPGTASGNPILSGDGTDDDSGTGGSTVRVHTNSPSATATVFYVGVATNSTTGAVEGFIATNGITYYLVTNNNFAIGDTLGLSVSSGSADPTADNWSLATGEPVAFCFLAGTEIRTPDGDAAVETLKIGDLVTCSDGRVEPVKWLGIQTVSTLFTNKLRTSPVRVKKDALGDGLPQQDLLLSPDHALLVDGVLIQAGALVNGESVTRETQMPATFTYYHVELADHSLVLAENVPAETFIDNVDRLGFDNWAEHEALYGQGAMITEMAYPRVKALRQMPPAILKRLRARSAELFGKKLTEAA